MGPTTSILKHSQEEDEKEYQIADEGLSNRVVVLDDLKSSRDYFELDHKYRKPQPLRFSKLMIACYKKPIINTPIINQSTFLQKTKYDQINNGDSYFISPMKVNRSNSHQSTAH